jgi:O-antigen ligase
MSLKKILHTITIRKVSFSKLILLLWPFYQLSRIPDTRLYFLDLLLLAGVVLGFKRLGKSRFLLKPLILFLSLASFSLFLAFTSGSGSLIALLYLLRLFLYFSLLFISLPKGSSSLLQKSFFLVPILGLTQYLLLPDLRLLKLIGYDDHYFRLAFPFLDPNYTGAVLSFIILYSLRNFKKVKQRKLTTVLLILSTIALALTFSRASYLSLLVGAAYLFLKDKKARLVIPAVIIAVLSLVLLTPKPFGEGVNLKRTFSIHSRLSNIKTQINTFVEKPILGRGYNTLPFEVSNHASAGADNSLIFILSTTGLIGLTSFIILLSKIWQTTRSRPYLQAGLLSLLVHSLFNNTLFYAPITILVLLVVNLSVRNQP